MAGSKRGSVVWRYQSANWSLLVGWTARLMAARSRYWPRRGVQGRHPLQTSDALGAAATQRGAAAQAAVVELDKQAGLSHGASSCPGRSRAASRRRRCAGVGPREAARNGVPGAVRAGRRGRRPAGGDRWRNARAVHRHGAERPGRSGGQRGDREGVAAGCGAGRASLAVLIHRRVLSEGG